MQKNWNHPAHTTRDLKTSEKQLLAASLMYTGKMKCDPKIILLQILESITECALTYFAVHTTHLGLLFAWLFDLQSCSYR